MGGFALKEEIKKWLGEQKHEVVDVGATGLDPEDDFVDYAGAGGRRGSREWGGGGILFCRNGYGMMIAANRFSGVRCGEAFDIGAVRRGRTDDDINCLSVPADYIKNDNVRKMIEVFWRQSLAGKRDISGGWGNWRAWVEEAVRMGL